MEENESPGSEYCSLSSLKDVETDQKNRTGHDNINTSTSETNVSTVVKDVTDSHLSSATETDRINNKKDMEQNQENKVEVTLKDKTLLSKEQERGFENSDTLNTEEEIRKKQMSYQIETIKEDGHKQKAETSDREIIDNEQSVVGKLDESHSSVERKKIKTNEDSTREELSLRDKHIILYPQVSTSNQDTPASSDDVARTTQDVFKLSDDVARTTQDVSKSTDDVGRTTQDVSNSPDDVARTTQDVSKSTLDVARTTQDVSKSSDDVARKTQDVSKSTDDVARTTQDISKSTDDVTRTTQDVGDVSRAPQAAFRLSHDVSTSSHDILTSHHESQNKKENMDETRRRSVSVTERVPISHLDYDASLSFSMSNEKLQRPTSLPLGNPPSYMEALRNSPKYSLPASINRSRASLYAMDSSSCPQYIGNIDDYLEGDPTVIDQAFPRLVAIPSIHTIHRSAPTTPFATPDDCSLQETIVPVREGFENNPCAAFCKECQITVLTTTSTKYKSTTYCCCFLMFFSGVCCPLSFLPFLVCGPKKVFHSCPKCKNIMGIYVGEN